MKFRQFAFPGSVLSGAIVPSTTVIYPKPAATNSSFAGRLIKGSAQ